MVREGLRERRRAELRQRISDRATRLFERDGFEAVTLAQVAAAADVSVKTVTNHFGAKEDLFFDAEPAVLDALVEAVARHAAGSAPAGALRALILGGPLLADPRPWRRVGAEEWEAMRVWSRCEHDSPTLSARRAAILHGWIEPLARASGSRSWAALLVGALMLRHDLLQEGLLETGPPRPAAIRRTLRRHVGEALDRLDVG